MLEKNLAMMERRWASSAPPLRTRLMEKPGTSAAHRHNHHHDQNHSMWGEKGGVQHTQYIRRLVDLRDELINQEETGLARALDRLRLTSISNREAARYRLKIKDQAAGDTPRVAVPQDVHYPRPMITTVEKFRQMRPQRRPPVIFPLQGKQLIESSPVSNGSATRASTEEGSRADRDRDRDQSPAQPGVEDTVRANLQRLAQPTSSIPNIGRKALRQEPPLELKSQSLQNMRNRVFRSTRPHLASPFMLGQEDNGGGGGEGSGGGGGGRLDTREGTEGEFHLTPQAYKLGPMTNGDQLDMDKLNQYYYICCLPETPSTRDGDRKSLVASTPRQGGQRRGMRVGGGGTAARQRSRRTSSERSSYVSRPFSDRSMVVSSDTELEASAVSNPRYRHSVDTGAGMDRVSLPAILAESPDPLLQQNEHGHDAFLTQRNRSPSQDGSPERRKRHIVIDMPHIIFNSPTPDISVHGAGKGNRGLSPPERPGVLSKTLKQNEIRHRELQNLLEDVKELNKRTETLNTQAHNTEMEAASSMC